MSPCLRCLRGLHSRQLSSESWKSKGSIFLLSGTNGLIKSFRQSMSFDGHFQTVSLELFEESSKPTADAWSRGEVEPVYPGKALSFALIWLKLQWTISQQKQMCEVLWLPDWLEVIREFAIWHQENEVGAILKSPQAFQPRLLTDDDESLSLLRRCYRATRIEHFKLTDKGE